MSRDSYRRYIMIYYVFKNTDEETGAVTYGFVPEDKVADKPLAEEISFAKLDKLPEPPADSDGKEYFLDYNAVKKQFFFKL